MSSPAEREAWPPLPLSAWKDTYRTLHRWTQMVGKVQLALTPRTNHFWNAPLDLPGDRRLIPLAPQPIAQFYERFMATLRALGIPARIWPMSVEVPDLVRFDRDPAGGYDADAVERFWRILVGVEAVLGEFRARVIGKCSPVHFFWGASTSRSPASRADRPGRGRAPTP